MYFELKNRLPTFLCRLLSKFYSAYRQYSVKYIPRVSGPVDLARYKVIKPVYHDVTNLYVLSMTLSTVTS